MNYSELRGLIRALYGTQAAFAKAMCISNCALSQKLNGRSEWTAWEIRRACAALSIPVEKLHRYFFCPEC